MRSTLRRNIGVLAIVLVAGLPAGRAVCEILCAPGVHATAAGDRHAAACHESSDPLAAGLTAVPLHGCADHAPLEAVAWLKAGRFDSGARPHDAYPAAAAFVRGAVPALAPVASTHPLADPPSYTLASIASVVLRI